MMYLPAECINFWGCIAAEIVNDQIDNVIGAGLPAPVRTRIVEKAVERIVDEVWDQVRSTMAAA